MFSVHYKENKNVEFIGSNFMKTSLIRFIPKINQIKINEHWARLNKFSSLQRIANDIVEIFNFSSFFQIFSIPYIYSKSDIVYQLPNQIAKTLLNVIEISKSLWKTCNEHSINADENDTL